MRGMGLRGLHRGVFVETKAKAGVRARQGEDGQKLRLAMGVLKMCGTIRNWASSMFRLGIPARTYVWLRSTSRTHHDVGARDNAPRTVSRPAHSCSVYRIKLGFNIFRKLLYHTKRINRFAPKNNFAISFQTCSTVITSPKCCRSARNPSIAPYR